MNLRVGLNEVMFVAAMTKEAVTMSVFLLTAKSKIVVTDM
jgi:phosphatidate phosphatase PAH1